MFLRGTLVVTMPSAKTWWWVGVTTSVAAIGAGVALVIKGSSPSTSPGGTPEGGSGPDPDSVPGDPEPPTTYDVVDLSQWNPISQEICVQWKHGGHRPNWRPELENAITAAVERQIDIQQPVWSGPKELDQQAFIVARDAMQSMCPLIPKPTSQANAEELSTAHFYWKELWGRFFKASYGLIFNQTVGN